MRMINEKQKKPMVEWIGLVRSARVEVDEAIGRNVIVLKEKEPVSFDDFRPIMERIALDLNMAKKTFPLENGPARKEEQNRLTP